MRIQRANHSMKLKLQNADQNLHVSAYSSDFQSLKSTHVWDNKSHYIEISIPMPDRIIIGIFGNEQGIELTSMSLAGIPFIKEVLNQIVEHKPIKDLNKVFDTPSRKTLHWSTNGYLVIDFFNPDPFAYHMYVGNKIKML